MGEDVDGRPTEFFVHEQAIAQLSGKLNEMMKGGVSESKSACSIWKDVGKDTFERFVQFAYTGDYSIPEPENRNKDSTGRTERDATANSSNSSPSRSYGKGHRLNKSEEGDEIYTNDPDDSATLYDGEKPIFVSSFVEEKCPDLSLESSEVRRERSVGKTDRRKRSKPDIGFWKLSPDTPPVEELPSKPELLHSPVIDPETAPTKDAYPEPQPPSPMLMAGFRSLSYPFIAPRSHYDKTCEPRKQFVQGESYSKVFLCHAALYRLGDLWNVESLKALALFKLHKTLCVFQLGDDNNGDVIGLVRYVYSEPGKAPTQAIGSLRSLACQYMATHAVTLSHDDSFMDLLAEGGDFVKDFFRFEIQRKF